MLMNTKRLALIEPNQSIRQLEGEGGTTTERQIRRESKMEDEEIKRHADAGRVVSSSDIHSSELSSDVISIAYKK